MIARPISAETARRMFVAAQHLENRSYGMMDTIRQLGCVQIDPTKVVIQTQYLVLFSRLGAYDRAEFDNLMWKERQLFEYWAHCASLVLTEHYPIFEYQMKRRYTSDSTWAKRVREWMESNEALHQHVLQVLNERDAVSISEFEGRELEALDWHSTGWTNGRNISRLLDTLWFQGKISVAGRLPNTRLWALTEKILPEWTPREDLSPEEVTRRSVRVALKALGVGNKKHIKNHFTRGEYPELDKVLKDMEKEGEIERVTVEQEGSVWKGDYYILDQALLQRVESGDWQPKFTLLSPFDNLICDRDRTLQMFNFHFRLEIYTPKEKRQYGFFVLPILDGDQLVGRVDPQLDRKNKVLNVHAVHWERKPTAAQQKQLTRTLEQLAGWLGAGEVVIK
jgi:hypothetical protein